MIKPTVGRVVWFYKWQQSSGIWQGPLAAHVCHVHSDEKVNLMVIGKDGVSFAEISVPLYQDDCTPPSGNYCAWMHYQKGQAQKTEQAEAVAQAAKRGFNS